MTEMNPLNAAQLALVASHTAQAGSLKQRIEARTHILSRDAREILWHMYFAHRAAAEQLIKDVTDDN